MLLKSKFVLYVGEFDMVLKESTDSMEVENFEGTLKKRLRLEIEKDARKFFIDFTQGDGISNVALQELQGIDDVLYEYYNNAFEKSHEYDRLDSEARWNVLDKKVKDFRQNFTDNNLKKMYENIDFTEDESKYIQLKNMRSIQDNSSAKNALVEVILRRKLFEIFGRKEISKMLMLISEKSFDGKRHIMQLMSDDPFDGSVSERLENEIEKIVEYSFNAKINCGGYAFKIDQCFFTPTSRSGNEREKIVKEDAQVISSYLEKFPFIRLLGDTKLEDDEYIVIYRAQAGHAYEGRHFIRVERDGTITEKDGNRPIRKFEKWGSAFQDEDKIIEIMFAVKEEHPMFGYTLEYVNDNCNGKNFEQTVEQAVKDKNNTFTYHCKDYSLKKDKEGNVVVCSIEEKRFIVVADVLLDKKEDENIECVVMIRDGYNRIIENYEGKMKPVIKDSKLINYDSFQNIKDKADEREHIDNDR